MKFSRIKWKYRVEEGFAYKLQTALTITPYSCPYFTLTADRWLLMHTLYAWDCATKFPDFDWIKTPSAIHDALHEAIRLGAIPESQNYLIDRELELAIAGNPAINWTKRQALKFRGWYVRTATGTVNERAGGQIEVLELPMLANEYTLEQYAQLSQPIEGTP
jgi:hypothetical protein